MRFQFLRSTVATVPGATADSPADPAPVEPGTNPTDLNSVAGSIPSVLLDDDPQDFVLGYVKLTVPPENIRIEETKFNTHIPTLRSNSDGLIKSGRAVVKIKVDLVFPNEELINNELRMLVAQFKGSPVLPLHSPYILNALFKSAESSSEHSSLDVMLSRLKARIKSVHDAVLDWCNKIDVLAKKGEDSKGANNVRTLESFRPKYEKAVEEYNEDDLGDWARSFADHVGELRSTMSAGMAQLAGGREGGILHDAVPEGLPGDLVTPWEDVMSAWDKVSTEWGRYRAERVNLYNASQTHKYADVSDGSILVLMDEMDISPIPDAVDAVGVRLCLLVFNGSAYMESFAFKDDVGGDDQHLAANRYLYNYLFGKYMSGNPWTGALKEWDATGDDLSLTYPTASFIHADDDQPGVGEQENIIYGASGVGLRRNVEVHPEDAIATFDRHGNLYKALYNELSITGDSPNIVLENVQVNMANKIAIQPTQGALLPAYQHLGKKSSYMYISLIVNGQGDQNFHDASIQTIQDMHHEVERAALSGGAGFRRKAYILVKERLFNLLGIEAAYIDDVTTETLGPQVSRVQMRLIEYAPEVVEYAENPQQFQSSELGVEDSLVLAGRILLRVINGEELSVQQEAIWKHLAGTLLEPDSRSSLGLGVPQDSPVFYSQAIHLSYLRWVQDIQLSGEWAFGDYWPSELEGETDEEKAIGFLPERGFSKTVILAVEKGAIRLDSFRYYSKSARAFYIYDHKVAEGLFTDSEFLRVLLTDEEYLSDVYNFAKSDIQIPSPRFRRDTYEYDSPPFTSTISAARQIRRLLSSDTAGDVDAIRAHPDLQLPTFRQAFPNLVEYLKEELDVDEVLGSSGWLNELVVERGAVPGFRALMAAFFPTYRAVGKIPRWGTWGPDDFAFGFDDFVPPDWYFGRKSSTPIRDIEALVEQLGGGEGSTDASTEDLYEDSDLLFGPFDQSSVVGGSDAHRPNQTSSNNNGSSVNLYDLPNLPSSNALDAFEYARAPTRMYGMTGSRNQHQMFMSTRHMSSEDDFRANRVYPTVRLFFIRPGAFGDDGEERMDADELFGYGAVHEVKVIRDRFNPDVAEITLINTNASLNLHELFDRGLLRYRSRPEVVSRAIDRDDTNDDGSLVSATDDTEVPFMIHEGTMMQIRMGYEADVADLPVVFNGQVAEVQFGDVIRMVCQSYASELTNIVNWYEHGGDADLNDAAAATMALTPAVHYGRKMTINEYKSGWSAFFEGVGGSILDFFIGGNRGQRNFDSIGRNDVIAEGAGSRRLENIFAPTNDVGIQIGKLLTGDISDKLSLPGQHFTQKFIAPSVPGLEVLHEIARLTMPAGAVCLADVPYGTRSTCFIGYPSKYYFARPKEEAEDEVYDYNTKNVTVFGDLKKDEWEDALITLHNLSADRIYDGKDLPAWIHPERYWRAETQSSYVSRMIDVIGEESVRILLGALLTTTYQVGGANNPGDDDRPVRSTTRLPEVHHLMRLDNWQTIARALLDADVFRATDNAVSLTDNGTAKRSFIEQMGYRSGTRFSFHGPPVSAGRQDLDMPPNIWLRFRAVVRRAFLFTVDGWVAGKEPTAKLHAATQAKDPDNTGILIHPRLRPFRLYHYADSIRHIIKNDIFTSRDEMANVIHMRHVKCIEAKGEKWHENIVRVDPSVEWRIWKQPADINILPENQKIRVVTEVNVQAQDPQRRYASYWNIADAVAPMYRGELIIRGNARIKPYDVVWINDIYNDMNGPIEVERVSHHFDSKFGFVTVIVPRALTFPANYSDYIIAHKHGIDMWGKAILIGGVTGLVVGTVVGLATANPAIGFAAGAYVGAQAAGVGGELMLATQEENGRINVREQEDLSFWEVTAGNLRTGSDLQPLRIIPLRLRGAPWTSGLIGSQHFFSYRLSRAEEDQLVANSIQAWVEGWFGISKIGDTYSEVGPIHGQ